MILDPVQLCSAWSVEEQPCFWGNIVVGKGKPQHEDHGKKIMKQNQHRMKAALEVIWVLDSICFYVYRSKHSMSNGFEAAMLGVYCTEMAGAN